MIKFVSTCVNGKSPRIQSLLEDDPFRLSCSLQAARDSRGPGGRARMVSFAESGTLAEVKMWRHPWHSQIFRG